MEDELDKKNLPAYVMRKHLTSLNRIMRSSFLIKNISNGENKTLKFKIFM